MGSHSHSTARHNHPSPERLLQRRLRALAPAADGLGLVLHVGPAGVSVEAAGKAGVQVQVSGRQQWPRTSRGAGVRVEAAGKQPQVMGAWAESVRRQCGLISKRGAAGVDVDVEAAEWLKPT